MSADALDRLDSWKEIASYLGRSVRTAKRWEAEGLPVRRQMHRSQGSVYAFRREIDAWRESRQPGSGPGSSLLAEESRGSVVGAKPAGARTVGVGEPGLVVLPFSFHGRDDQDAYVADGCTDETIAMLSRVRGLRVISRTSSMALAGTALGAAELAQRLGVDYLLEGTVQLVGEKLRVTVRLVDARVDRQLWSSRYAGDLGDLFDIQERIARRVVSELELRLSASPGGVEEVGASWTRRPEANLLAWRCLQQARQQSMRWHKEAIDRAIELLHRGIEEVGERADLCAALGRTHLQYREAALDPSGAPVAQAERWHARAVAADPGAPEVPQLAGWIAYARSDIVEATAQLQLALQSGANEAETLSLLSNCLLISGQGHQVRPLVARLLAIDPLTPVNQCMPGFIDAMEGRFESAIDPYRRMFELDTENPLARLFLVWVQVSAGRVAEARAVANAFPPGQESGLPARIARLFAQGSAEDDLGDLADVEVEMTSYGDMLPRLAAQAFGAVGRVDAALEWLTRAVERGFVHLPYLAVEDPLLETLRGEPRFSELMVEVERRWLRFPAEVELRLVELSTV